MPKRLVNGRRGAFLVAASSAFALVGASWVVVPSPSRERAFEWLPEWVDRADLGWLFIGASVVVIVLALLWRWVSPTLENIAFGLLTVPPVATACVFIVAFIGGLHPTGWINAVTYMFYSLAVWTIAGWPNPPAQEVTTDTGQIFIGKQDDE